MIYQMGGQIAGLASGINFFRRLVYFGDIITCYLVISKVDQRSRARAEARCIPTSTAR
ncbi:hypothetical protein DFAR_630071 [Desulfarculales bacterium]